MKSLISFGDPWKLIIMHRNGEIETCSSDDTPYQFMFLNLHTDHTTAFNELDKLVNFRAIAKMSIVLNLSDNVLIKNRFGDNNDTVTHTEIDGVHVLVMNSAWANEPEYDRW